MLINMREVEISNEAYDIIRDIHGHADELEALLQSLGYVENNGNYGSPHGRKAVFLGDYIDRGPKVRRSLEIVRAMIDSGTALGIMGNHELNALRYHTKDRDGYFMRAHYGSKLAQHAATLDQFGKKHHTELLDYVEWFSTLPLSIDLGGIRVAHACWHPAKIELVRALGPLSGAMLEACSQKGTAVFDAIDTLLCGLEAKLPEGESFETADGQERHDIRIRWWESSGSIQTNDQYVFPPNPAIRPSPIQHLSLIHI